MLPARHRHLALEHAHLCSRTLSVSPHCSLPPACVPLSVFYPLGLVCCGCFIQPSVSWPSVSGLYFGVIFPGCVCHRARRPSLLFMGADWSVCVNATFCFMHSSLCGHWGCFHPLAIVNSAAVVCVMEAFCLCFLKSWKLQVQMISWRDSQTFGHFFKKEKRLNMHIFCYKGERGRKAVWWEMRVPSTVWRV